MALLEVRADAALARAFDRFCLLSDVFFRLSHPKRLAAIVVAMAVVVEGSSSIIKITTVVVKVAIVSHVGVLVVHTSKLPCLLPIER